MEGGWRHLGGEGARASEDEDNLIFVGICNPQEETSAIHTV